MTPIRTRTLTALAGMITACVLAPGTASAVPGPSAPAGLALPTGSVVLAAHLEYGCTVGLRTRDAAGRPVVITAAHCMPATADGQPVYGDWNPVSPPVGHLRRVSPALACPPQPGRADECTGLDYAAIDPVVRDRDLRRQPNEPIAAPPAMGTIVCKRGRITGRTCGPVTHVDAVSVRARLACAPGDSGSGLTDAAGANIGILSRVYAGRTLPDQPGPLDVAGVWARAVTGRSEIVFTRSDAIRADLDAHQEKP